MPRLLVHDRARADVDDLAAYIARDKLDAALRFYDAAEQAFDRLAAMPGMGPRVEPGLPDFPGLRYWPITHFRNYLVLYSPIEGGVEVYRVIHGARDLAAALRSG